MEAADLVSLIEGLDENVDDLKEALAPFLQTSLTENAAKLPVLDKAQLYVLITYAIESLLFCRLLQFIFQTLQTDSDSVSTAEWRKCKGASYLQRIIKSQAVL